MDIRFATDDERSSWNMHILANPDRGNVFQGYEFAEQKRLGGWTHRYIIIADVAITILEKSVIGLGKLWYLPKGPGVTTAPELESIVSNLKIFGKKNGVFLVKIEPELLKTSETLAKLENAGLIVASPIQPNFSTVTIDLTHDLETVMASLNQKGRHAIRRAERDGVTVKQVKATEENCRRMYTLLQTTAEGSFRIRSYEYYKKFWIRYAEVGFGQLFFAYFEGDVVAGAYAIAFGTKGTYKDGASVRERTAYGASHLLQWDVIRWMKSKGVTRHDLCGAPPSDQINNTDHPHYGIGRFKTSFNKEVTDYIGVYDIPLSSFAYTLWTTVGERIVTRLHSKRYHENYY